MCEKFFGNFKKNECLKHFALTFSYQQTLNYEDHLIPFFESLPLGLQSLKLTLETGTMEDFEGQYNIIFKCLEKCVTSSSLKKLFLVVSNCEAFYSTCVC